MIRRLSTAAVRWTLLAALLLSAASCGDPPDATGAEDRGFRPDAGAVPQLTPDGSSVAISGSMARQSPRIWLVPADREYPDPEAGRPLSGSDGALPLGWNHAGDALLIWRSGTLMELPLAGSAPRPVVRTPLARPAAQLADGGWVFTPEPNSALSILPPNATEPRPFTTLEAGEFSHGYPQSLPGGQILLHVVREQSHENTVEMLAPGGNRKILFRNASPAAWMGDSRAGTVYWAQGSRLMAWPSDGERPAGRQRTVAEDLPAGAGGVIRPFSLSDNGRAAYLAQPVYRFQWFTRDGSPEEMLPVEVQGRNPALSPDGTQLLFERDHSATREPQIWVHTFATGETVPITKIPAQPASGPAWLSENLILYAISRGLERGLYQHSLQTGTATRISQERSHAVESASAAGVLYCGDQQQLKLIPPTGPAAVVASGSFRSCQATLSPDGKWIVYTGNQTGRFELYLRRADLMGRARQLTTDGAFQPHWSQTSPEVFFLDLRGRLHTLELNREGVPEGRPRFLFETPVKSGRSTRNDYEPGLDGRFLVRIAAGGESARLRVLQLPSE